METNEQGLTIEEKVMFSILGIILIIGLGVLIISMFSKNERILEEETPVIEVENKEDEDIKDKTDIYLKEDNTVSLKNNLAYVSNLSSKKENTSSINKTKVEEDTASEETSILQVWDFPKDIVTESVTGTTIIIDKYVVLENGELKEAQVTVRKLIDDIYMIQDISSGSLELTEGSYKYYYTYANVTKELVLNVSGYLNPTQVNMPNIKDVEGLDREYLNNYNETLNNSLITLEDNVVDISFKGDNRLEDIPLYLTIDKDLTDISVSSNTFGVKVNKNVSLEYDELDNNQIVMWINLECLSTTEQNEIIVIIDNVYYILNLRIHNTLENDDTIEDKDSEKEDIEDKDNLFDGEETKEDNLGDLDNFKENEKEDFNKEFESYIGGLENIDGEGEAHNFLGIERTFKALIEELSET